MKPHELDWPLGGILMQLGLKLHQHPRYYKDDAIFWSLVRLFGAYYRVVSVHDPKGLGPNTGNRSMLDHDIEDFLIRSRILLDDVAVVVRQLLPEPARGITGLHHDKAISLQPHISLFDLQKSISKAGTYKALNELLAEAMTWMLPLRSKRDGVAHWDMHAFIFGNETDPPRIAFLGHGKEEFTEQDDGTQRIISYPTFDLVNDDMACLVTFLTTRLPEAVVRHAEDYKLATRQELETQGSKLQAPGIALYRQLNGLLAAG